MEARLAGGQPKLRRLPVRHIRYMPPLVSNYAHCSLRIITPLFSPYGINPHSMRPEVMIRSQLTREELLPHSSAFVPFRGYTFAKIKRHDHS